MTMHLEARRRQMHMDRVCEARRRMALAAANTSQTQSACCNMLTDAAAQADLGLSHHNQYVSAWLSPLAAPERAYDHSRQGPVHPQSWQTLGADMRLRQNFLSSQNSPPSNINCKCYHY